MKKPQPDVKHVTERSAILEGTEGLLARISRELQSRRFGLMLNEQSTGGLLVLQPSRTDVPLPACEVVPSQEKTPAQTTHWITEQWVNYFIGLTLAVSGLGDEHLNSALATPDGTFVLHVHFSATRCNPAIRQEACIMMALNMLRCWLNNRDIISKHGWIEVAESMALSV